MPVSKGQLNDAYYPMAVFTDVKSAEEEFQMWLQFRSLDAKKKDILVSNEIVQKIQEFEKRFQLQEVGVAVVSFAIRKIFFGELDFVSAEERIKQALTSSEGGDPSHAHAIAEAIQKEIMTIVPAPEPVIEEEVYVPEPPRVATVRLPLLKAMSEYKRVADQLITTEKLKLRNSQELVRPTLSNWIRCYREELGIGFHEPVQRGKFLFQTQNGKKLTNEDRAKLNLILKSIEEEFPLEIDPKREMIIFPVGSDASMELTQVNSNARPVPNRFIQARAMPTGVRHAAFPKPVAPESKTMPPQVSSQQPSPARPVLATLKPLFSRSPAPEKNISGETLHFSTGHVLPAEKANEKKTESPIQFIPTTQKTSNEALRSLDHPTQGIKREPGVNLPRSRYSIRPLRLKSEEDQAE